MNTVQKTSKFDEDMTVYRNATAAFNKTLKEIHQSLNAGSNRGPLTQTEYRRAVAVVSQANFDYAEKMRQICPEAFPDWYHKNIPIDKANDQNIDAWDRVDASARRQVRDFVIMADDPE